MPTSSIDDLLMSGALDDSQANIDTETHLDGGKEPAKRQEIKESHQEDTEETEEPQNSDVDLDPDEDSQDDTQDEDEYGNKKTSDPDNEVIRKRLKKQAESIERRYKSEIDELRSQLAQSGASKEVQNAAKDFQYNPEQEGDWQQQLASFVRQTVSSMNHEQQTQARQAEEQKIQRDFESKFRHGMEKFSDFVDVIEELPFQITNPMTLATRAMEDPAAFLYAAAKRNPEELERISKIRDPYVQMTEMGRLEERMRKNKASTSAPRPIGRTKEDASFPAPKSNKKEKSIEDLIAEADAKKMAQVKQKYGRR